MIKNVDLIVDQDLTLDPKDWKNIRQLGHQMIEDMMDYLENINQQPSWKKIPDDVKKFFDKDIPENPEDIKTVYEEFKKYILPYPKGNIHPRFWAWAQGTGTPFGVLSEMLAATMNPNVSIGEHSSMYVEEQVIKWCKQIMNFPEDSSGILLSGGSMANITALIVARNHHCQNIRKEGLKNISERLIIYYSNETHSCMQKAVEAMGLGSDSIRKISVDKNFQINLNELISTIETDIAQGLTPFCIVGNAGTVNTGAIDPLDQLLSICRKYHLWFHIDGAFGALAKLAPEYTDQLKAIEDADSLAYDMHKWMYMPYEIGCTLIKNAKAHENAFALNPGYLLNLSRGLSAGPKSINNFGLELSRGFKSLKVWMSIKEHGIKMYSDLIKQNIAQALFLSNLISKNNNLELLAPVSLNVVCYRYTDEGFSKEKLNELNKEILMQLQEQGIASPSMTILNGLCAIRVCILNHRSKRSDFELLAHETVRIGNELLERYNNYSI